ncbi:MAG: radical SAM protein [Patescibacteria group bacterium]
MKILLISLNQQDVEEYKKAPTDISALGVRYLSSYLKSQSQEVKILFLAKPYGVAESQEELEQINNLINEQKPDLIGLSLMSNHFFRAKQITKNIKEKFSALPVIWGGIHPTIDPAGCLAYADLVCVGEGELPLSQLAQGDNLKQYQNLNLAGIWYKKNGQIVNGEKADLVKEIDRLPNPDYDLENHYIIHQDKLVPLSIEIFRQYYPASRGDHRLISTRGCPHACAYCCNSVFRDMYGGGYLRKRFVEQVIAEMKVTREKFPFLKSFKIMDDSFTVNDLDWIRKFSRRYQTEINLPFYCLISPLTITQEKLDLLVAAGLSTAQMGLQSGSDRINQEIYLRQVKTDQFLAAAKLLEKYQNRVSVSIDVIVDNPYETESDLLLTAEILNQIKRPFHLSLFSLAFYPGTELYRRASQDKILANNEEYLDKQFHLFKKNYLNKIIYLVPHLPPEKVKVLLAKRNKLFYKFQVELLYLFLTKKNKMPSMLIKAAKILKHLLK